MIDMNDSHAKENKEKNYLTPELEEVLKSIKPGMNILAQSEAFDKRLLMEIIFIEQMENAFYLTNRYTSKTEAKANVRYLESEIRERFGDKFSAHYNPENLCSKIKSFSKKKLDIFKSYKVAVGEKKAHDRYCDDDSCPYLTQKKHWHILTVFLRGIAGELSKSQPHAILIDESVDIMNLDPIGIDCDDWKQLDGGKAFDKWESLGDEFQAHLIKEGLEKPVKQTIEDLVEKLDSCDYNESEALMEKLHHSLDVLKIARCAFVYNVKIDEVNHRVTLELPPLYVKLILEIMKTDENIKQKIVLARSVLTNAEVVKLWFFGCDVNSYYIHKCVELLGPEDICDTNEAPGEVNLESTRFFFTGGIIGGKGNSFSRHQQCQHSL